MVVFVCLHITLLHYHHYADVSESIELKMILRYILSSMWLWLSQFSQLSFMQYIGLCVFSLHVPRVMVVRIRVQYFVITIKSKIWTICHCLWLGHDNHDMQGPHSCLYMIRSRNVASFKSRWILPLLYMLCIWWNKAVEKKNNDMQCMSFYVLIMDVINFHAGVEPRFRRAHPLCLPHPRFVNKATGDRLR